MSESGLGVRRPHISARKARIQLFVANPGSDSSDDEGQRQDYSNLYRYHPPPLPPNPAPLTTNLLPARVPRYPSSHPSSLSSPSSTSSPAQDESTPPPSTPGLSGPALDLLADSPSSADLTEIPSKPERLLHSVKAPFNPRARPPAAPRRPAASPTASTPDSYSSSTVGDRVLILVTADSERYVNVDISGATNPAFIRECVFTKLNIFDEEDQAHFSIYRTEIGSFALSDALSDDKLFDLCREFGDERGSLKLLVSHSSAHVHEPYQPLASSSLSPSSGSTILPPFVPLTPANYAPLKTKSSRAPRSPNGSVSSTSERLLEPSAGYEADYERDRERSTITPNELPSMNGLVVPNGRGSARPASPHPQSSRSSSPLPPPRPPLYDKHGNIVPPPPPPPPLSPNRATFEDNNLTPPGTQVHVRVPSDAASEREQAQSGPDQRSDDGRKHWRNRPQQDRRTKVDTRERRQRGKVTQPHSDVEDSSGPSDSWIMVNNNSRDDSDHPLTPVDSRQSPSSAARVAARQQLSPISRYKPASPYTGRPLAIPAPPRNPPPSVPATSPDTRIAPPRHAGHPVPSKWPVTWKGPDRGEQKAMPTSSATWSRLTKGTKSMDNLRAVASMNAHPPNLQPGGGRRMPPPPLPVSRGSGILSSGTPTSALGTPKSYDGRHIRPLPIQGSSHTTVHEFSPAGQTQYGTRIGGPSSASLMSPSNDPYPRPQSAFGDAITSPNQRYQRQIQTSNFGSSLEGDYGRSGRAPSPTHPFPTSSSSTLPYRSNRQSDLRSSDLAQSPISPRSPRFRPSSANDAPPEITTPNTHNASTPDEGRWPAQLFTTDSETSTIMPSSLTFTPSSGTMTSMTSFSNNSYESEDSDDDRYWQKRPTADAPPSDRPKSILRGPPLTVQIANSSDGTGVPPKHPTFAAGSTPAPGSRSPSPPTILKSKTGKGVRGSTFTAREEDTWAPRPPPEDVYERLEDFFPEHDLDKPVIEASSGGTSPTSTDQTLAPAPPVPSKARIRGKKSIRLVAQERKKYIDRTSRGDNFTAIQRKRSTKLWDSRVEEVDTSNLPESPSTSEGPTTFKWVRGELIGRGTYGRVYLALNATTGEMIAVKQVEIPRTASDKNDSRQVTVVQALKLESETLKVLDHPNIVQYLGFEETPANLSIFLEYVPGGSIGSCLLKHGKFDEEVTKSFTSQILAGLEYLHSKGILHRDLKSDNILVETSGICKISDFGISKRTDDHNDAHTAMQGTVFWMAPEVINTQKKGYNFKIDIWSIGCVVLEMWAGTRPWLGDELVAVMFKLFQSKLPPPVPDGLVLTPLADDFRKKCFAINPEERPPASELRKHPYLTLSPGWVFDGFAAKVADTY
ncbi:MAP kinase [Mycena belliarum]|uniref:MAP kinase n=1 Tax=Mycena belliarum TaxID=1033014 RepID=A0AAD6XWC0_9AGAR|nr:MAP kinase [Mycena belliae]